MVLMIFEKAMRTIEYECINYDGARDESGNGRFIVPVILPFERCFFRFMFIYIRCSHSVCLLSLDDT